MDNSNPFFKETIVVYICEDILPILMRNMSDNKG